MPTVEFNTEELIDLLGKDHSIEELRDKIPQLGVDMKSIDAECIIMEVFPNRPDMLSIEGFGRALKGFMDIETGLIRYDVCDSDIKLFVDPSVADVRPYIAAGVIGDVDLDDQKLKSLMDLQEKLHITHGRNRKKVAIGVHDLDHIAHPFAYKAVKPSEIEFIPLDMEEKLNLGQILQKHPKGREFAFVLDDFARYPVIVDKNSQVLSFPPIINGELTRVTGETRDLFIEVTGTSKIAVSQALNIIMTSIADGGGKIYSVSVCY